MQFSPQHLSNSVANKVTSAKQAGKPLAFLAAQPNTSPTFNTPHALYDFGDMIAIAAASLLSRTIKNETVYSH